MGFRLSGFVRYSTVKQYCTLYAGVVFKYNKYFCKKESQKYLKNIASR